jgi:hypothetical protein
MLDGCVREYVDVMSVTFSLAKRLGMFWEVLV